MKWQLGHRSENVEDRRGSGLMGGGLKIGCLGLIIVGAISLLTKENPMKILQLLMEQQQTSQVNLPTQDQRGPAVNDEQKEFISVVPADTEDRLMALRKCASPGLNVEFNRDKSIFATPSSRVTCKNSKPFRRLFRSRGNSQRSARITGSLSAVLLLSGNDSP